LNLLSGESILSFSISFDIGQHAFAGFGEIRTLIR